jgi:phospholipid transport system substrate-binding protein
MTRRTLALAVAAALALPALAHAAAPAPAAPGRDRTESFVAALKKVKKDDGKLTEADKAANARMFGELDGFLDFEALTTRPIAPRADKLSADQLASFRTKFRELIRLIAYPNAGGFFRKATCSFQGEAQRGELTLVPVKVRMPEEDLDTEVQFQWAKVGGSLKIVDVDFEGDSLVKDYQNQLAKIVDKGGVAGLFKALDDRLAELAKGPKAKKN